MTVVNLSVSCIPGTHHFGDKYPDLCSQGLKWPHGAGYTGNDFTGQFDFTQPLLQNTIPTFMTDLAVDDAIFFNHGLIHAVPANGRPRHMIALTFFEGEISFNSRPRAPGEFSGLTYAETYIALRAASFAVERAQGRNPCLNYHGKLGDVVALRKYLRLISDDEFNDIYVRVLKNSYPAAYRFITHSNPA